MPTKIKAASRQRKPGAAPEQAPLPQTKIAMLVSLMNAPEGATINQLIIATGWQVHSVRGAIAGHIKKKLGLNVVARPSESGRTYRIEPAQ
jgi:hypothetical protein